MDGLVTPARRRVLMSLLGGCAVFSLVGCADFNAGSTEPTGTPGATTTAVSTTRTSETATDEPIVELERGLAEIVDKVEDEFDGEVGIAVYGDAGVAEAGNDGDWRAWSTIKVPIAIVALQRGEVPDYLLEQALSVSDNAAAGELWAMLGSDMEPAEAVEELVGNYGGGIRAVDTIEEYGVAESPFGWVPWTLAGQAEFAAHLPCIPDAGPVRAAMGDVVEWQQEGLGLIDGAFFKGGWSDEEVEDFSYTYRQFGGVETRDGVIGLAVIAHPDDGTHETAAKMLDELSEGVADLIDDGTLAATSECQPQRETCRGR